MTAREFLERKQHEIVALAVFHLPAAEDVELALIEQPRPRTRTEERVVDSFVDDLDPLARLRLEHVGVPARRAYDDVAIGELVVEIVEPRILEDAAADIRRSDDASRIDEPVGEAFYDRHVQTHRRAAKPREIWLELVGL